MKRTFGHLLFGEGSRGKRGVSLKSWRNGNEIVVWKQDELGNDYDGHYFPVAQNKNAFIKAVAKFVSIILKEYNIQADEMMSILDDRYSFNNRGLMNITLSRLNPYKENTLEVLYTTTLEWVKEDYRDGDEDNTIIYRSINEINAILEGYNTTQRLDDKLLRDLLNEDSITIDNTYFLTLSEIDEFLV